MSAFKPLPESASTTREALDQLDELHAALSAVADLSAPGNDLNAVNRDNLAMLLTLLLRLQGEATQRAWEGLQAMRDRESEGAKLADVAALIAAKAGEKSRAPEGEA